jgi:ubiquinone/menaquinone biosynthesis C-methylase UbiE
MAEASKVRRIYDKAAARYDSTTKQRFLEELRAKLLRGAQGDVLELGVGTGATFAHYPGNLTGLAALDISEGMLAEARRKARDLPFPVEFHTVDFQTLPFPDATFDTVVSSLALCGIPHPPRLFAEVRRVLRPGGRLLAVEHIRPPNPVLGLVADLASPVNNFFIGCYLNRRTPDLLRHAGFHVEVIDSRFFGAVVALVATPGAGRPPERTP